MRKIYRFFIPSIIILFVLSHSVSVYSDDDNSGGGNDGGSVTGGDVGAESISGSATDEQGNTTTFDSQGNITGESGPGGGPVSDGTTQSPSAASQGDIKNDEVNKALDAYNASDLAKAEANLNAALAAQELNGATLADQVAISKALEAWDAAISAYTDGMNTSYPTSSIGWSFNTSYAAFNGPEITDQEARIAAAAASAAAAAPPAGPVIPAAVPVPAAIPNTSTNSGLSLSAPSERAALDGVGTVTVVNIENASRETVATVSQTYNPQYNAGQTEISVPGVTNGLVNIGSYDVTLSLESITQAALAAGISIPSTPGGK